MKVSRTMKTCDDKSTIFNLKIIIFTAFPSVRQDQDLKLRNIDQDLTEKVSSYGSGFNRKFRIRADLKPQPCTKGSKTDFFRFSGN